MQFWQVLTRIEICLKWTPPLTFPGILKSAAYLGKDSTSDVYILRSKANCFSIKGLHHRCLYSKARGLTLNKQDTLNSYHNQNFFSIMQHTCNKFLFHISNSFKQSFVCKIIRAAIFLFSDQINQCLQNCVNNISLFRQPIFTSKTYIPVSYNHASADDNLQNRNSIIKP